MDHDGITMSETAAAGIRALLDAQPGAPSTAGLRVEVVDGGCSGHQYRLALDDTRDGDRVYAVGGARLLVAADALPFVDGAHLDYDPRSGFRVDNPNVVYGCGCGSSFELREDRAEVAGR